MTRLSPIPPFPPSRTQVHKQRRPCSYVYKWLSLQMQSRRESLCKALRRRTPPRKQTFYLLSSLRLSLSLTLFFNSFLLPTLLVPEHPSPKVQSVPRGSIYIYYNIPHLRHPRRDENNNLCYAVSTSPSLPPLPYFQVKMNP